MIRMSAGRRLYASIPHESWAQDSDLVLLRRAFTDDSGLHARLATAIAPLELTLVTESARAHTCYSVTT